MTDAQGNKIKKLRPVFIKSEPDRNHVQHVNSDENLPDVQKKILLGKEKGLWIHTVNLSLWMMNPVMKDPPQ